jgi:hypothetical protein
MSTTGISFDLVYNTDCNSWEKNRREISVLLETCWVT